MSLLDGQMEEIKIKKGSFTKSVYTLAVETWYFHNEFYTYPNIFYEDTAVLCTYNWIIEETKRDKSNLIISCSFYYSEYQYSYPESYTMS